MGYKIAGLTIQNENLALDEIHRTAELPVGFTAVYEAGNFRLKKRSDQMLFGYVPGQHSCKKYLYPPEQELYKAQRTRAGWKIDFNQPETERMAFLGVRPCEIQAIKVLDRVFLGGEYTDTGYAARSADTIIIAVNCYTV